MALSHSNRKSRKMALLAGVALLAAMLWGCSDEGTPTSPEMPSTPETPSAPTGTEAFLRVAVLTDEARKVDVAINGEIVFRNLTYPQVSQYAALDSGDYRIQFLPSGQTSPALVETTMSLGATPVTVAVLGVSTLEIETIEDDRETTADRARVRFLNAVADFPAPLDLAVVNGPTLAAAVQYLGTSGYEEVIPGIYDLVMRRSGTRESGAVAPGQSFVAGAAYTVFGVGSLREQDIQLMVARDSQ